MVQSRDILILNNIIISGQGSSGLSLKIHFINLKLTY